MADGPQVKTDTTTSTAAWRRIQRRRWGVGLLTVFVPLGIVLTILLFKSGNDSLLVPEAKDTDTAAAAQAMYCSFTGWSLVCQNIQTGASTTYRPPAGFGEISDIQMSPDKTKLLISTFSNPLQIADTGKVYITDLAFKVQQQLPQDTTRAYVNVTWADNSLIAAARRPVDQAQTKNKPQPQSAQTTLGLYDTGTQKLDDVSFASSNAVKLLSGVSGRSVFIEERTANKPTLHVLDVRNKKVLAIDTSKLQQLLVSYATILHDSSTGLFYLNGSNKQDQPALAIARVMGNDHFSLEVQKTIEDSTAYVPLSAVDGGMLVKHQADNKPAVYGVVGSNGDFSVRTIKPSENSVSFGLPTALSASKQSNKRSAADFVQFANTKAPVTLQTYVRTLATDNCPANRYNQVWLLAYDANQAVIKTTSCVDRTTELRYVAAQANSYNVIGTSRLMPPSCSQVSSLKLSQVVAPSCQVR